ncbi:MAG: M28 family peptidase [Clostridiales bacterium]|jgi:hypothetical protein|nr:M28 family peptidase [Clostridiales bacterium]
MKMKMTRLLISLLLFILISPFVLSLGASGFSAQDAFAAADTEKEKQGSLSYNYFIEFAEAYKDRTAGTPECETAAEYLINFFLSKLQAYEPYDFETSTDLVDADGKMSFTFKDTYNASSQEFTTANIVFVQKSSNNPGKKQVIIGAHYDNSFGISVGGVLMGGEGASDNASGISAMMGLAHALDGMPLPFDVVFAAFSAEEYGLLGSQRFVEAMSPSEIANTLLVVNLDCVSGGDYLYLYTDETKRKHGEYLYGISQNLGLEIKKMPNTRVLLFKDDYSGLPYTTYAMTSDHAPFYKVGMNVAYFMSANFEITSSFELRESKSHPNIVNTKDDTFAKYMEYYGDTGYQKTETIVELFSEAFTDGKFTAVMEESRSSGRSFAFWSNETAVLITYALAALLLLGLAFLIYIKLKGKDGRDEDDILKARRAAAEKIIVFEDFNI